MSYQTAQQLLPINTEGENMYTWSVVVLERFISTDQIPLRDPYPSRETIEKACAEYRAAAKDGDPVHNYAAALAIIESYWMRDGVANVSDGSFASECMPYLYHAAEGDIVPAKLLYYYFAAFCQANLPEDVAKSPNQMLIEAAYAHDGYAELMLGQEISNGVITESDDITADEWVRRAIDDGCVQANLELGSRLMLEHRYDEAVGYLSALPQHPYSKYYRGLIELTPNKNYAAALALFNEVEESYSNDATYCWAVSVCYLYATGSTFNVEKGIEWMKRAKALGSDVSLQEQRLSELGVPAFQQSEELAQGGQAPSAAGSAQDQYGDEKAPFDLEAELNDIVGLDDVKDMLRELQTSLEQNKKREAMGRTVSRNDSLNLVFLGNPGTGKTTMGRLVAHMLKEMGYLKSGQLVEVSRSDLVADIVGGTEKQTRAKFEEALGGVLFVDEAYALDGEGNDFGPRAVDELVKCIGDHPGEVVVILAGYEKDMDAFFRHTNDGLRSRFPRNYWVTFKDYSAEQLALIAQKMLEKSGWILPQKTLDALPVQLGLYMKQARAAGDARMAGHFATAVGRRQDQRSARDNLDGEALVTILPEDLEVAEELGDVDAFDLDKEFENLIGMQAVKDQLHALEASIKMDQMYKARGVEGSEVIAPHMVFTGNPGTGKTTVARMMARMLAQLGVIDSPRVVDVKREDLVAGHVGQTGEKAMERFSEAIGGVLFVDEAYRLGQGGESDFGREAAEALMQFAEDNRGKVVVILAGYEKELNEFFENINPGMKSRFSNTIDFPDYSSEELVQIACIHCRPSVPTEKAIEAMRVVFESASKKKDFGNGRYARNVADRANENKKLRHYAIVESGGEIADEDLLKIEAEDIEEV